ncbi:hypothetical protein DLAC_10024 [Tieghemostelium lacteum]|uniref:SUI1 domain-containing protein n=1 Tax=Tieghemostelium lacteum TaxID=361077 RepID=A0A151Z5Y0_TIELA|nr:hypothetical protein DLAC_10024 [Tieghemostelium lacteum]|eukprot:KYQ89361.1 hypothetical protein DLAC_10024 [Tieghemostelium lacteum]
MSGQKKFLFKNEFPIGNQSLISGSDVKKLKTKLMNLYKNLTVNDLDVVFNKKKDVGQVKLLNKINIYTHQGDPILFEYLDKLYPSIYMLWKIPNMLPRIQVHAGVFQYISGGADLMLAGCVDANEIPKEKNQIVSVVIRDQLYPISIGYTLQDQSNPDPSLGGKIASFLHLIDDKLYNYGSKKLPDDFITKIDQSYQVEKQSEPSDTTTTTTTTNTSTDNQPNIESSVDENNNNTNNTNNEQQEISIEDMDKILMFSFLGAIKKGIKDNDLPMVLKTVFNKYIVYYTPIGMGVDEVNLKKSSYKKVSVFLKEMESKGLIQLVEESPGNIELSRIYRNHPEYIKFKPFEMTRGLQLEQQLHEMENLKIQEQDQSQTFGNTSGDFIPIKSITEVYSVPKPLIPWSDNQNYLSFSKIQAIIQKYIQENNLDKQANMELDPLLFGLVSNEKFSTPVQWSKSVYYQKLKEILKIHLELTRELTVGEDIQVRPYELIEVSCKKSSNKFVIEVKNLENFFIPIKEMAQEGMKHFSASTTIKEMKNNKNILKIQGRSTDRVIGYIIGKYKIPKKYIINR